MPHQAKTQAQLIAELEALRQRNAKLEARQAKHQRAQQVQNALYRIADAASAVQDMEKFYAAMHNIVGELMYAENFYITLYDEARDMINFPFYVDEHDDGDRPSPHKWHKMGRDEARGFTAYVLRSGQPLLAHRGKSEELIQSGEVELLGHLPESWLGVPLKADGRAIGVVVVQSYNQEVRHSEEDKDLLIFVAQHIATALERARLLADTHQRNAELSVINSVQRALATELDMHVIYELIGDQIREIFDAQVVTIATFDHEAELEHFRYLIEKGKRYYPESRPLEGVRRHLIRTRQLVLINENYEQAAAKYGMRVIPGTEAPQSLLFVPLVLGDTVIGYVSLQNVDRERAFSDSDVRLLTTLANSMSVALENARLFDETNRLLEETQQRNAELGAVNSISQAIGSQLDPDALIELVGEQIRQTFSADIAYVALHDRQAHMIHFAYEYGDQTPSRPFGKGLTERIIESKQALLINRDIESRQAELDTEKIGIQAQSYLGVPIVVGQKAIGVISVQSISQEGRFDEADKSLLTTIAASVGAAIHNAQLYQETQRHAEEMAALAEVGRDISTTLDLPTVLERIASHARDLLAANSSAVYLADPDGQTLRAVVALSGIADEIKASAIQLGDGIIGDLAQRQAAEVINDANNDPRARHIPGTPRNSDENLMAAPLLSGDRVSGMMAVWRTGFGNMFTEADLRFLEGLARQGAIAIGNAHLFEQAQEAQAAAESANRAKSTFLANMSHELRTPLNAIMGFTRIVKRRGADVLPEKQIENLDKVLASAEHLLGLINTILDIAKIEAGRMDVQPDTFDAGTLVDVCIAIAQPMIKQERVNLIKDVAPDLPPVHSDREKVKQVLLNLLSNAAKFTHVGQITVGAHRQGDTLVIDVADTGIGISEEDLERIFDEFHQADNGTTRQYGGTGLGLAISRHLARLLGGELTATSTVGVGATFTLTVPLRYGVEETAAPLQPPAPLQRPPSRGEGQGDRSAPLILAIDDDPDVIYLLQENLGEAGYRVAGALGGEEGMQKARKLRPFAITLDIMMPNKDGWQVLHDLKTDAATRDIPIIVLSIVDKKALGYRLGADDYLVKPLDSEAVLAALNRLTRSNGGVPPRRLLIVDDDPQVVDIVRQLLEERNYEIEAAEDGIAALEVVARARPDVILLDLVMPQLDGFGVIEQLEQDPNYRGIPIVVLTAKTLSNGELARLEEGVCRVMHKQGLDGETLIQELERALSGLASPPVASTLRRE